MTALVLTCKGTFYLPYQLNFTKEQLLAAFPSTEQFFEEKRKWDPEGLLSNAFMEKFGVY